MLPLIVCLKVVMLVVVVTMPVTEQVLVRPQVGVVLIAFAWPAHRAARVQDFLDQPVPQCLLLGPHLPILLAVEELPAIHPGLFTPGQRR
jgi:hypothetical protein